MSLHRLGSGDRLQTIGDLYGVHKSTLPIVLGSFVERLEIIYNQFLYKLQANHSLKFYL